MEQVQQPNATAAPAAQPTPADVSAQPTPAEVSGRQDLRAARFERSDLTGATFRACDLSGVVMRAVDIADAEIDAPWLFEGGRLIVNGVDVVPLVNAELNRRFPGRALWQAQSPEQLRQAWDAVVGQWRVAVERAQRLDAASEADILHASVGGEWSFVQTMRHLILATDMWLGRAVLNRPQPFHPLGLGDDSFTETGHAFTTETPSFADVLAARADRQQQVADVLATITSHELVQDRPNPHQSSHTETVRSCLHTILHEEWEHLRFATRDLDALAAERGPTQAGEGATE